VTPLRRFSPRLARLSTNLVVRRPWLWRFFRGPLRATFDALAPEWETRISPEHLAPLEAALARIDETPRRIVDVGTGTGRAAIALARRYADATVVGVDLSPAMVEQARAAVPREVASRLRFDVADADSLPFGDGEFDLVVQVNMIPFFDELARVVAAGGHVVLSFSRGAETPIFVAAQRVRGELTTRGFADFAEIAAGAGVAFLARRPPAR
jgi:SAM-dependent methyltransferase